VGVTTLVRAGFYPTAAMYVFYGGFCIVGFVAWWRVQRDAGRAAASSDTEEVPA
jgi:nicotinamide mononucleotide transporter